jgi:hypothetical protein
MNRWIRRSFLAGGVALFVIALWAIGGVSGRAVAPASYADGPLAVVLLPSPGGSELVVADLEAARIVRRVRLRSLATDISTDTSTGLIVAAQSGGVGDGADNAVSIMDARTGELRYVTLPMVDPGDVACVAGRAYVLHSVVDAAGTVVSIVDIASGRAVGGARVLGCTGLWTSAAGALWTATDAGEGSRALIRFQGGALEASVTMSRGPAVFGLADAAGRVALLGPEGLGDAQGKGAVRLLDPVTGSVVASAQVSRLARAPRQAVAVAGRLMVGDWSGDMPEGRVLEAFDVSTLRPLGAVRVDGVPCALAAWRGRLLAVDREKGRLLMIDPVDGRTLKSIDLGAKDLVFSDVVAVEQEAD